MLLGTAIDVATGKKSIHQLTQDMEPLDANHENVDAIVICHVASFLDKLINDHGYMPPLYSLPGLCDLLNFFKNKRGFAPFAVVKNLRLYEQEAKPIFDPNFLIRFDI